MSEGQVVVFELTGVRYCIDIMKVREILRMVEITPVSEVDAAVEGIINLRDQVFPAINLSRRLGLAEKGKTRDSRIIVVETGGKQVGLMVDKVLEVGSYTSEQMQEPMGMGSDAGSVLKGIIKKEEQLWLMLNLNEVA